ncbi:hypothetical protein V5097_18705 [Arenibacter palladensis]|uniref:hypothetical protein n=1 Tax=Arenibacter palladensis TaxID=237373 RepID=UPI002FD43FCF
MKKPIYFLFIAFNSYFCHTVFSQNCDSLEEWNTIIEKEFPELNTSRLRSGSEKSNRILYNLYSDKYFIPFANKSFENINSIWGNSKWKKLRNCRSKKKYSTLKHIGWLNQFALEPLWNKRVTDKVRTNIIELNKTRSLYNEIISKLNSGIVAFDELIKYKAYATKEFRMLMPSEIETFLRSIKTKETSISNSTIIASANEYANKKIDINNLQQLYNFRMSNSLVYDRADESTRKKANEIVNHRIKEFLDTLVPLEQKKLYQIQSLDKVESFYLNFNKYFSNFTNYSNVKALNNDILEKKTAIIVGQSDAIHNKIAQSSNIEELNAIESVYLSRINQKQATIVSLKNSLKSRAEFIKRKEREIAINKEKKQKAFNDFADKRISEIKNLRQLLKIKYESNLPTFENLQSILVDFTNTINNDATYNVKDANHLKQYIEAFGYMSTQSKGLSDINSFENSKGYRIIMGTLDTHDKNIGVWTGLVIPNAPEDIINLYRLELNSNYREVSKSVFPFIEEFERHYNNLKPLPLKTSKYSGFYTNVGMNLYNLKVDDKGNLRVTVHNNFDGETNVMAERIDDNTLKVTSWTNITDVYVNKGDILTFTAQGKIRVGLLSATPDGLDGWESFSKVRKLRHSALIGKVGHDSWFEIGSKKTIKASSSGRLYLRINETHVNNNDIGYWSVNCRIK